MDLADIEARAAAAVNALQTYAGNLKSAPDAAAILARLREAWPFDLREAQSGFDLQREGETIVSGESAEDLANRRTRVLAQLDAKVAAAKALDPADPAQAGATHCATGGERDENASSSSSARDFPVLPRFTLGEYAGEVCCVAGRSQCAARRTTTSRLRAGCRSSRACATARTV